MLQENIAEDKIYNRVLRFATLRPRSEKEIKFWFQRKKVPQDIQNDVFNRLKNAHFVDDTEFAKWWVDQRLTFRPKSKRALSIELSQKGVDREIISQALEAVDDKAVASVLAKRRLMRLADYPPDVQRQKVSDFLARRGFSWETIREVVESHVE